MTGPSKKKHPTALIATMIFFVTLGWSILLFQGLPASDIDDWDKLIMSEDISWGEFASSFFTPWCQSQNWLGQTNRYDEVHYKRIVGPIVLKLSQQLFGLNLFMIYLLSKGIFFAGTVTLTFILLLQSVPLSFALIGTVCFLFIPIHYAHALWIADPVTLCYFFLFLGILLLAYLNKNMTERGSRTRFTLLLGCLLASGWIGIKAKEPMLVLSLVVFAYSIMNFRNWRVSPFKYILLNLTMLLVAFQLVPIEHWGTVSLPTSRFKWATLSRLLFFNYECGYENEPASAFFSWTHVFPVSVTRTLGFFLLWGIVASLLVLFWRKWIKKDPDLVPFWGTPMIRIGALWFLIELPFLGMFQPDPRYFSGTMAPLIILLSRLFYCTLKNSKKQIQQALGLFLIISVTFNIVENAQNSISLRLMIGRRLNYFQETARTILQDLRGSSSLSEREIGSFYCSLLRNQMDAETIGNYIYFLDLSYDFGNKSSKDAISFDNFKENANSGYRYFATFTPPDFVDTPQILKIRTLDGINEKSLLERAIYKKKKKKPAKLSIYKFVHSKAGDPA